MKTKIEYVLFFAFPTSRKNRWYPYEECDNDTFTLREITSMKKRCEASANMANYKFKIVRKTTTFEEVK